MLLVDGEIKEQNHKPSSPDVNISKAQPFKAKAQGEFGFHRHKLRLFLWKCACRPFSLPIGLFKELWLNYFCMS